MELGQTDKWVSQLLGSTSFALLSGQTQLLTAINHAVKGDELSIFLIDRRESIHGFLDWLTEVSPFRSVLDSSMYHTTGFS